MVNKFAAKCNVCDAMVPAKGGRLTKAAGRWIVTHLACENGESGVIEVRFSSGLTARVNRRGRCEDAPCCGCCS